MTDKNKKKLRNITNGTGRFFILLFFLLLVVLPIYWLFVTSIKIPEDISTLDIQYWPNTPTFDNYIQVWANTPFPVYLRNSIIVSTITGIIVMIIAILGGYGLSRYKFKAQRFVIGSFLVSQIIPFTLLLIPLYIMFGAIELTDTLVGLILLYVILNVPFCVVIMQGFFKNIPVSIEEAAQIDGCTKTSMMIRIVIPIMLPAIVSTFIFAFIGAWNELLGGVMFINTELLKTIPVGLNAYVGQFAVNWGEMTAGGMLALIPTALLFAFAQRYIVEGLTAGAVKG